MHHDLSPHRRELPRFARYARNYQGNFNNYLTMNSETARLYVCDGKGPALMESAVVSRHQWDSMRRCLRITQDEPSHWLALPLLASSPERQYKCIFRSRLSLSGPIMNCLSPPQGFYSIRSMVNPTCHTSRWPVACPSASYAVTHLHAI